MFPQLKKINNESGVILFIVLMTAIVIMLFSVGILTQSVNEMNYAQQQIDQIVSDQLAKGIFWNAYTGAATSGALGNVGITTTMQGRLYVIQLNSTSTSGAINSYSAVANYDTF